MLLNPSKCPELIVEDASLDNLMLYIRNLWRLDTECRVDMYSYRTLCMQHIFICNVCTEETLAVGAVHTAVTVMLDSH